MPTLGEDGKTSAVEVRPASGAEDHRKRHGRPTKSARQQQEEKRLSGHHPWLPGGGLSNCLVKCNCHGVRLMTLAEMHDHMREAHPAVYEGLGLAAEGASLR
jgi:hypothetical protein